MHKLWATGSNPPAGCMVPSQGTGDNGNVTGYIYQDNANASLSHTAIYFYDTLSRLDCAQATGSSQYTYAFGYDRYGNMACTPLNGQCATALQYDARNHVTSSGYTYDLAGNLMQDPSTSPINTYHWDAEGRLSAIAQNGATFETMTYNARGQVVEADYPGYNAKTEGVFDPAGRELGYINGVNGNWYDRDIWAVGRMIAQSDSSNTYFLHPNLLHSDTQITDASGAVRTDFVYYPWQIWTHSGTQVDAHFAGFEQSAGPNYGTPARTYSGGQGRWLTPDPGNAGADSSDPQSWNAYSYAGNNPTTNVDPDGEDYRACINNGNGGENCFYDPSDYNFQQAVQQSGATLQNGQVLANVNGQQVQIGTYQQFVGPGEEGPGVQDATVGAITFASLVGGLVGGGIAVGGEGFGALGRMLGVGVEEATPVAVSRAAGVGIEEVVQKAGSTVGSNPFA